jgi:hypothetical protein
MKRDFILIVIAFVCGLVADYAARTALNDAILVSDMDAAGHKILNLPVDQPFPLLALTDANIANDANIAQSKLNLNGAIPASFIGTTSTTAAQGDLAEYVANKSQANGYASLDGDGKIPSAEMPVLAGTGTVTNMSVVTANGISGSVATSTTTPAVTLTLGNITPDSVTVNGTGGAGFLLLRDQTSDATVTGQTKLWSNSIGNLCYTSLGTATHTAKFTFSPMTATHTYNFPNTTGTLAMTSDLATAMVGVGGSHKGGLVIDTGASGSATDYLARDASWKAIPGAGAVTYAPTVATPILSPSANSSGPRTVSISDATGGVNIFYNVGSSTTPFTFYPGGTVSVTGGVTIYSYAARAGYNNSAMASYTNPNAP